MLELPLDAELLAHVVGVVHGQSDALALEVIHVHCGWLAAILGSVDELQLSGSRRDEVRGSVLNKRNERTADVG